MTAPKRWGFVVASSGLVEVCVDRRRPQPIEVAISDGQVQLTVDELGRLIELLIKVRAAALGARKREKAGAA